MAAKLKHYEYLGQCFDINEVDPLNLPNTHKGTRVFKFDPQKMEESSEGILYPENVYYTKISYVESSSVSHECFSEYDFQENFKEIVNVGLSIPGIFSFGGSETYKSFKRHTGSREKVFNLVNVMCSVFSLTVA